MNRMVLATGFALSLLGSATMAPAAMLGGKPDPVFDMPGPGDYYLWDEDLTGLSDGDTLLDFTVEVPFGGAFLRTFQVFAADGAGGPIDGRFNLSVNQPGNMTWTSTETLAPYSYHNYLEVTLSGGSRRFLVTVDDLPQGSASANVRFGDVISAVPIPTPALLLAGGLTALAGLRRRRKPV